MGDANTQPQQRERNEIEKGGNDVIQSYVGRHSDKHTTDCQVSACACGTFSSSKARAEAPAGNLHSARPNVVEMGFLLLVSLPPCCPAALLLLCAPPALRRRSVQAGLCQLS